MKYINLLLFVVVLCVLSMNSSCYAKEDLPFKEGQVWNGTYYNDYNRSKFKLIIRKVDGETVHAIFAYEVSQGDIRGKGKDRPKDYSFLLSTLAGEFENSTNNDIQLMTNAFFINLVPNVAAATPPNLIGSFGSDRNIYTGITSYKFGNPLLGKYKFSAKLSGTIDDFPKLNGVIKNAIENFDYKKHSPIEYAKQKIERWKRIKSTQKEVIQVLQKYPVKPPLEKCINEKISSEGIYLSYFDVDKCRAEFNGKLKIIRENIDDLDEIYEFQSLHDTDLISKVLDAINNPEINEDEQKIKDIISDNVSITRRNLKELASSKKAVFIGLDISKQLSRGDVKKAFEKHGAILEESTKRTDVYNFGETEPFRNVKAVCFFTKKKLLRKQELIEITLSYPRYQVVFSYKQETIDLFTLTKEQIDKRNAELKSRLDRRHSVFNELIRNYGSYHEKNIFDNQSVDTSQQDFEILKNFAVVISGLGAARYNYRNGYIPYPAKTNGSISNATVELLDNARDKAKKTQQVEIYQWTVDHGKTAIIFLNKGQTDRSLAKAYPDCFYSVTYRNIESFNKSKGTMGK